VYYSNWNTDESWPHKSKHCSKVGCSSPSR
jgi:hypothetical protein